MYRTIRKVTILLIFSISVWLTVQFFLPIALPFLLGAALALAAEPMVGFLNRHLHLPRPAAAGIGVTAAFCFIAMLVLLICAVIVRELGIIAGFLPDLEDTARSGMSTLSGWLLGLIARLPLGIRDILTRNVNEFFSGSSQMLDQAFRYVLNLAGGVLKNVPDSALVLGTGIISSFMISAKFPKLRAWITAKLRSERLRPVLEALKSMKAALIGWLKAQCKLMIVTFTILTLGFVLLRIPYAPLWAALVSLVDAFPVLGTGTVLLPWSLICLLQGDTARAIGLLSTYVVISLTRSLLEPKLVGSHLGLDPLATLVALYAGYKLWGLGGMLLSPLVTVAAVQLIALKPQSGK